MSGAEYNTLTEHCLRASAWLSFPHDGDIFSHSEDLFSHAHRMLIGGGEGEDDDGSRGKHARSPVEDGGRRKRTTSSSSSTDAGRGTGPTGMRRGDGSLTRTSKVYGSRPVVFRSPPPLLPMSSPALADVDLTPSSVGGVHHPAPPSSKHAKRTHHHAGTRALRRVSPPPLLPMPSALFATHSPPSPSLSPPTQRTSPSTSPPFSQRTPPLTTPPSTPPPPGMAPTPTPPPHPPPAGYSYPTKEEAEEEIRLKKKACAVCGDLARSLHFGGLVCDSCKAFFRRAVLNNAFTDFVCGKNHHCTITVESRRSCQACRFAGCLRAGMEVSLAKREDEASGRAFLPSFDHHHQHRRRLERFSSSSSSVRSHDRLHSQNLIYGKSFQAVSSYSGHIVGGASLAQGPASLALGPGDAPGSLQEGPLRGFEAQTHNSVLRRVGYSPAGGGGRPRPCGAPSGCGDGAFTDSHTANGAYGAANSRTGALPDASLSNSHSPTTPLHHPSTNQAASTTVHSPPVNHTASKSSHDLTKNYHATPAANPSRANHTKRVSPSPSVPHGSARSLSPCRRSPVAPWPGAQPDPTPEEHSHGSSGGNPSASGFPRVQSAGNPALPCGSPSPKFQEGLEAYLGHSDHTEIRELQKSYSSTFDAKSLPVGERMIRSEELSKLYTCFIQRRARFLVGTPLYTSLAEGDRLKLLHVAVAMSTYFTGAHLIDTKDYTWKNGDGTDDKTYPVMSASTIRQFLTHEQFVYVMKFYTTYSPVFSDQTVAILMQVLSLFYPEPGLADPTAAEQGRLHYVTLLSRYLRATYGPQAGPERLRTLISSQQEARQLVDLLQHVELTPQVPRQDVVDSQRILMEGIRLVCDRARESLANGVRERHEGLLSESPGPHDWRSRKAIDPAGASSVQDAERLDFIERTFTRLANCEDPYILAEARRILPADLVRRFFHQLQCTSASRT